MLISILKSTGKYKVAEKATNKVMGDGLLSNVVAAKAVKKSNQRSKQRSEK